MELTKLSVVPLVEEDLSADLLDDDVPGVDGPGAAHQRRENGVGGENVGLGVGLGQSPNDRVVGGGDGVEDAVDATQRPLVLDVDAVVRLVVELHRAGADPETNNCRSKQTAAENENMVTKETKSTKSISVE